MSNSLLSSPLAQYQADLERPEFVDDPAQAFAVAKLQALYEQLLNPPMRRGLVAKLLNRQRYAQPITGLYLWGGVGRGKTYLMDTFYNALPFDKKMRTHFHRFMGRIHHELSLLKDQKNPLEVVADTISREARVICFDEFFVTDITDAMILAGLLQGLFARGVTLVATSNIAPEGLYENGLQRERFLPAIALLQQHAEVINIDGGTDYRLRALTQAALFHTPAGEQAEAALASCFEYLSRDDAEVKSNVVLVVQGRDIPAKQQTADVVWFDFAAICDGPRSQRDYVTLASEYQAVVVSGVPVMGLDNDDQARRFIYMVDEFYDRNIKLVLSADAPIDRLYDPKGRLCFEFQRTQSRLLEMQSEHYLNVASDSN